MKIIWDMLCKVLLYLYFTVCRNLLYFTVCRNLFFITVASLHRYTTHLSLQIDKWCKIRHCCFWGNLLHCGLDEKLRNKKSGQLKSPINTKYQNRLHSVADICTNYAWCVGWRLHIIKHNSRRSISACRRPKCIKLRTNIYSKMSHSFQRQKTM